MANDLTIKEEKNTNAVSTEILTDFQAFENAQRIGKMLMQSEIVPAAYHGNLPNVMVALEIAARNKVSPIVVMQNLHVIKGSPRWSSRYLIAAMTTSRVANLHYEMVADGKVSIPGFKGTESIENLKCRAIATDRQTGEERVGPWVSMDMAVKEGWYGKDGSKWKTMPDVMIRYRAATFFANVYYPELSVGMDAEDDVVNASAVRAPVSEVVQSGAMVAPAEETPAKPKRAKKSAPVKDEAAQIPSEAPTEEPTAVIDTDFSEVAEEPTENKPAPVAAPMADDSDEWNSWGDE